MNDQKEFLATEPIGKLLFKLSVPTVIAQLINMLYNVVDRIYIGHMPGDGSLALTGVGVCMPILMIVSAFAALVSSGGAPRASIFMGEQDKPSVEKFLKEDNNVIGIDRCEATISHSKYKHYLCDVRDYDNLPDIDNVNVNVLINNAGTQNESDIDINLKALIHITEKYGIQKNVKSILNIGSASGHTGAEFPEYCASKGGVMAYTKNVAMRVAQFGATCNSLDPGGVLTPLNDCVINDKELWDEIMGETPLKRWATPEEIAEWAYFLTMINSFCTGQNILVDGGESINYNFVWKKD